VGAQLRPPVGVEAALEEGPEDRRLDERPVQAPHLEERPDLGLGHGEHVGRVEEAAVEPGDLLGPEHPAAAAHQREHLAEGVAEEVGPAAGLLGQAGEDSRRQHPGVLGEEAEEDPVQEVSDVLGVVAAGAEGEGQLGEVAGGGLGDLGRLVGGAQLLGRGEYGTEDREGLRGVRRREVVEGDDLRDRREVGEVGPDLDRV
jgi:hypothetical protein